MIKNISGVLPSQKIKKMIETLEINSNGAAIETSQIQPASLDLRLGNMAYRVRASFLTGEDSTVKNRLTDFGLKEIDIREGAIL